MPVQPGQMLSHYRLIEKLGEGGMGVVWKALDSKLEREVALKILPEELASDPERLGRFEREAKAVAALNHPNIVTVYSVEEAEGTRFITMELVKGKSLTELIPRNGLPLGKFFEYSTSLADAISSAHQQGITHRDLKPDNVMVGDDGRLKVFDFGLAKLREEARAMDGSTQMPTATVTQEGKILGTVSYMSPEQAEGKSIDHRSDIFSMGVMLYQMATGQRPFKGDTSVSIISSIMKDTPSSITDLNQTLPRHLGRIVKRCLAKQPERRFQTALSLRNELEELKEEIDSGEVTPASGMARKKINPWYFVLAAVAVVVVVSVLYWQMQSRGPDERDTELLNASFTRLTASPEIEYDPNISPDGKSALYASKASGSADIYLIRIGGEKSINLTEDCKEDDSAPSYSPDGESIAFRSERDGGGIFVMGATGESVTRLSDFGYSPSWSPDGKEISFSTVSGSAGGRGSSGKLWAVDVVTGERRRVTEGGDAVHPAWSPDGRRIAYWSAEQGNYDIWTIPAEGGVPVRVTRHEARDFGIAWSSDGYIYFNSDRGGYVNLWRVPIDSSSGAPLGDPQAVTSGGSTERLQATVSSDGKRIAYAEAETAYNLLHAAFDPESEEIEKEFVNITSGRVMTYFPDISPDGEWIAYTAPGEPEDVYVVRIDGTGSRQLTRNFKNRSPVWSPDGRRIAFQSNRSGSYEIWAINSDGSGLEQLSDLPDMEAVVPCWSPDGTKLVFLGNRDGRSYILDLSDSTPGRVGELPPFDDAGNPFAARSWSPNGDFIAGVRYSEQDNRGGILLYSLEERKYVHLIDSGENPKWLNDNRRLLFYDDGALHILDTETLERREILTIESPAILHAAFSLSGDNRMIVFARVTGSSDLWMLTLE